MSTGSRHKESIPAVAVRRLNRPEGIFSADPDFAWAQEVGRFVLAFGSIEHTSIACLYAIPTDPIGDSVRSLPLKQRLVLLQEILEGRAAGSDYESLASIVKRVISFVDHRNLVAHSPLHYSIYGKGPGAQGVVIRPELSSTRGKGKRLGFDSLCKLVDEVERLSAEFSLVAVAVFQGTGADEEG